MADSGVINSGHEPNSVQSLLQCPFERRTLEEKLKVKELGLDQPDSLIYCEELFAVPVCHSPTSKKFHQPQLVESLKWTIKLQCNHSGIFSGIEHCRHAGLEQNHQTKITRSVEILGQELVNHGFNSNTIAVTQFNGYIPRRL